MVVSSGRVQRLVTRGPGTYDVRMYVGDELVGEQEFEVKKDPV